MKLTTALVAKLAKLMVDNDLTQLELGELKLTRNPQTQQPASLVMTEAPQEPLVDAYGPTPAQIRRARMGLV